MASSWNRGLEPHPARRVLGIARGSGADLAAAEYVSPNRDARQPLFDGSELSVTFVRTAFGPERRARTGRGEGRWKPAIAGPCDGAFPLAIPAAAAGIVAIGTSHFGEPVVLLRALRLSFAYAGQDLIWKSWRNSDKLPAANQADGPRRPQANVSSRFRQWCRFVQSPAKATLRSRTALVTENPMLRIIFKPTRKENREIRQEVRKPPNAARSREDRGEQKIAALGCATPSQRGFVIVAVLWILAALSALATIFSVYLSIQRRRWPSTTPDLRRRPGVGQSQD